MSDTGRAQAFFSAVLGWRFSPGRVADGWNIEGVRPLAGMYGGAEVSVVVPMFAVDGIHTAVANSPDPSDRPASDASLFQMSSTFLVRWRAST